MTSEFDLNVRGLKREYFKAQKKVWKYQRKLARSPYTARYDPYKTHQTLNRRLDEWKRWGVDVAAELRRRNVWLIDPSRHNQTYI